MWPSDRFSLCVLAQLQIIIITLLKRVKILSYPITALLRSVHSLIIYSKKVAKMADTWTGAAYQDEPDDWCIVLCRSVEGKKGYMYACRK